MFKEISRSLIRPKRFTVYLPLFAWILLAGGICGITASPAAEQAFESVTGRYQPDSAGVELAFDLIYHGKFDQAGELLKYLSPQGQLSPAAKDITEIVRDYQEISSRRQSAREAVYREQTAELEKLKSAADVNEIADVNEPNDVNEISSVMTAITRASEFADEQQKQDFLNRPFVKRVLQERIDEASELESQGKWLDAYLNSYSWLQAIYPDNQGYEDYSQQLIDKANIVASFQDSPCESSRQRYEGIEKKSFIRAIDALQYNYVSIIDFRKMAVKAIKRCELLAEVMSVSFVEISQSNSSVSADESLGQFYSKPDEKSLASWWAALATIQNEVNQSPTGINKDAFSDVFQKILDINTDTVQLPESVLIAQFAEAALSALDPHTVMIWPKQVEDFEKLMTNEFTGVGIEISKQKGQLTVASLLPDTPAYDSGLDAGDIIEAADGIPTKDMTLSCAVKKITGPKGTNVILTVRSPGEEKSRDITITRDKIVVSTIRGWQRADTGSWRYFIDERDRIGYVRITSFSDKTADDFESALDELEKQNLKGLVLDLRFNVGGLLTSAIEIADKFVKQGRIVSTHPRFGISSYAPAHRYNTHPDYPLVILINSSSASASEIVAGAMQDPIHARAILVGQRTHGKGSVQTITQYPQNGAQLKYTMAYYHLPSGRKVESRDAVKAQGRDDWGVGPDIEIELRSDEFKEMIGIQKDNDVLVKADHNDGPGAELKKHDADETLKADPQLAAAVLVVKAKLLQAKLRGKAG